MQALYEVISAIYVYYTNLILIFYVFHKVYNKYLMHFVKLIDQGAGLTIRLSLALT